MQAINRARLAFDMPALRIIQVLMFLCACAACPDNRFTLIDYPNASSTQAWGMNSRGDITCYYRD